MSDWELVENQQQKMQPSSDWEIAERPIQPVQEGVGTSLFKAPYRIGSDFFQGGVNLLKSLPDYYEKSKSEIPGAFNTLTNDPLHFGSQALAGLSELGQNVFNMPYNLINYASERLNLIPKDINQKIQMARMPSDTEQMINQTFGEAKNPGDELTRGLVRNIPALIGAKGIENVVNPLNYTAKNIAKNIVKAGEENKNKYSSLYDSLFEEAKKKGYGDLTLVKPDIDIKSLKKYSPPKSIEGVEDFLKDPTIENAHYAKSDLLGIQRKLNQLTTFKTAERKQFNAVNSAIDNIENNMFKTIDGKIDNKLLNKYNTIQKGYFEEVLPYKNDAINAFKRKELSPNELINSLSKGEFMAKRGSHHPELGLRKMFPWLAKASGFAAAGALGKTGYDYLTSDRLHNE